jgi:hypothetical protein
VLLEPLDLLEHPEPLVVPLILNLEPLESLEPLVLYLLVQ